MQKNTSWAVNVWKQWSEHRRSVSPTDWPPHPFVCSAWDLNQWLCRFVLRKDGENYPPNTLYQLCCGKMRYIREVKLTLDQFSDPQFTDFRHTINSNEATAFRRPRNYCKTSRTNYCPRRRVSVGKEARKPHSLYWTPWSICADCTSHS